LRATCRGGIDVVGVVERPFGDRGDHGGIMEERAELVVQIDLRDLSPGQSALQGVRQFSDERQERLPWRARGSRSPQCPIDGVGGT
jgi:hypothetical protein